MKRLTPPEIDGLKRRLFLWQTPESMASAVNEAMNGLGSPNLFNQSGLAFLRDAWIAAEFGGIRNADEVRLVSDDWPDFEMRINGLAEAFEAVEADNPDRRRGVEYREGIGEIMHDPEEEWIARAEQAPEWLQAACRKKADKKYSSRVNLVIYLNLMEYGIRQTEVETCFRQATTVVKDTFAAVWILWKKQAYQVWPEDKDWHTLSAGSYLQN